MPIQRTNPQIPTIEMDLRVSREPLGSYFLGSTFSVESMELVLVWLIGRWSLVTPYRKGPVMWQGFHLSLIENA